MIPYVSFGILTYVLWLLPILLRKYGVYHGSNAIPDSLYYKPFIGMLYGSGEPHNGILWFLACLFVTEIIFYGTYRTGKTVRNISLILIFFAFLGYVDALYTPIRFPFSANIAFSAVVFYGIGYLLKDLLIDSDLEVGWTLVCLSIGLIIAFLNDRVDMNYRWYGNPILFYASSLLSIYAFISLFKKIPHNSLTDYVGQNSLIFFLLQNIGFSIVNVLSYLMLHSKLNSGELNLLCAIGYVFLSILVLFPVAYFINNKMPIITGKIPSRDKVKQMSAQQF